MHLYPILIEPLTIADGGGYAAYVPDLPGCMSDGETPQEAYDNAQDAIGEWLDAWQDMGRPVPKPVYTLDALLQGMTPDNLYGEIGI